MADINKLAQNLLILSNSQTEECYCYSTAARSTLLPPDIYGAMHYYYFLQPSCH